MGTGWVNDDERLARTLSRCVKLEKLVSVTVKCDPVVRQHLPEIVEGLRFGARLKFESALVMRLEGGEDGKEGVEKVRFEISGGRPSLW